MSRSRATVLLTVLAVAATSAALVAGRTPQGALPAPQPAPQLAPFSATPQEVVDRMLQMAEVKKTDVVYDLGSGDGRLVITAAKRYGSRGVGIDIDPALITQSRANARKEGVENLVEFRQQDALTVDVSPASVVTLYLLSGANLKLRPTLQKQLKPGSRIVSHQFGMGDWVPTRTETITDQRGTSRLLYLWVIGPS
jgi:protein-L-isoaspartate O-methyltransferase